VVVTGLGPVSSIGVGVAAFGKALREGRSGISRITSFDASGFPHQHAGEVRGFDPAAGLRRLDPARAGRASQFAAVAARLAVKDGRLDLDRVDRGRVHAVIGTTSGESQVTEALTAQILGGGFPSQQPQLLEQLGAHRLANAVSEELELRGESLTLATACSASNYAIGYAYDLLSSGEADAVLAGGADAVCRWAHAGFFRLGALTDVAVRPFDRDRSGILTGEGGAVLLLETYQHARARGARIQAELLGYGLNCDANHPVSPDSASIASCMRLAQRNAGVKADEVDYICAHGTGTQANDLVEAQAIREVFGPKTPPVSSIKSMIGHTMGAACGFGAIASVVAIRHGFLPPTINYRCPDPDLVDIDPVPNVARSAKVRVVQNDGFAFGGNNAIVMIGAMR
jgi:3-oxoacyl-[acyl-carrier-protein] synthase II